MLSKALGDRGVEATQEAKAGVAIRVEHLTKRFRRYTHRHSDLKSQVLGWLRGRPNQYDEFDVLKDVSFTIPCGQMVAIVGRNGAGKTTLLRVLASILEPDAGSIWLNGRVFPLLELGAGFASELSGHKNVYLYGSLLGLDRREISRRFAAIVEFSGIGDFFDMPVKHYSSGMLVRLAFAIAAQLEPDVLLLDEILAVGDAEFQAKCLNRIAQFRMAGKTIVLVTHSLSSYVDLVDRALLLDHGSLVEDGPPGQVLAAYQRLIG
jgi:ABC-type polysaccharide/polyol phosphate transport system ATPase subunit